MKSLASRLIGRTVSPASDTTAWIKSTRRLFSAGNVPPPDDPHCVIVGGGVAGVSLSWQLAKRGVPVTLLEKSNMLCAGATWHAAGLVTRFAGSPKLKKLHVRSLEVLTELHQEVEGGISLHLPGSIRIVTKGDSDRYKEAKQHIAMAKLYDDPRYPTRMIGPEEIAAMHPLIDVDQVECGVHTPLDGDIDPTSLVNAIASKARESGLVNFQMRAEVEGVRRLPDGAFVVQSADGREFKGGTLVNAAGLWSKRLTDLVDGGSGSLHHAAFIIEHQYVTTESIQEVADRMAAKGESARLPVLRDLKGSSYIRQECNGLLIGPYENDCRLAPPEWRQAPPQSFEFDLFQERVDAIEDNILAAIELIPRLGEVGLKKCTNGPTIWAPDSLPRCGATRIPGYFDFNTLTYGIAQSIPLAEYLSHIIVTGEQPFDLATQCCPLRHGKWANEQTTAAMVQETYAKNNTCSYGAFENRKGGREFLACRSDPLHQALSESGAHFGHSNGVESPAFFLGPRMKVVKSGEGEALNECKLDNHDWAPIAREEIRAVTEGVGISHASFSKIRVSGPRAHEFLSYMTTAAIPNKEGPCRLTYGLTSAGNVQAEFSVSKTGENEFYLIGSRDYAAHDSEWFRRHALRPSWGGEVTVEDISSEVEILHVAGPASRLFLSEAMKETDMNEDAVSKLDELPFLQYINTQVEGVPVKLFRVSFTGESGFELHCPSGESAARLWRMLVRSDAAASHDLRPFGSYALNAMRIEKGFKLRGDLDFAHYTEAGIDAFIGKKKREKGTGAFLGQDESRAASASRQAALFRVHTGEGFEWSIVGDSPIVNRRTGETVGFTTTAALGGQTGETVALGYLHLPLRFEEGKPDLSIECFGSEWGVEVLPSPPVAVSGRKPWADVEASLRRSAETETAPPPNAVSDITPPLEPLWIRIAELADIPPGRATERRVGRESVVLMRGEEGVDSSSNSSSSGLKAFYNVCQHRGCTLLSPGESVSMSKGQLRCGYHGIMSNCNCDNPDDLTMTPFPDVRVMGDHVVARPSASQGNQPQAAGFRDSYERDFFADVLAPFGQARPLPAAAYLDENFYSQAKTDIFDKACVCIGVAADVRNGPVTRMVADSEVSVWWDPGSASFRGTATRPGQGVHDIRVVQEGCELFVLLQEGHTDVSMKDAIQKAGLEDERLREVLRPYELEKWEVQRAQELKIPANWILLVENFIDALHVAHIHPEYAVLAGTARTNIAMGEDGKEYVGLVAKNICRPEVVATLTPEQSEELGLMHLPPASTLPDDPEFTKAAVFIARFPNCFFFLFPNFIFQVSVTPLSENVSHEKVALLTPPGLFKQSGVSEEEWNKYVEATWKTMIRVNTQDVEVCTRVQEGVQSEGYRGGRFSRKDKLIFALHQMAARRMVAGAEARAALQRETVQNTHEGPFVSLGGAEQMVPVLPLETPDTGTSPWSPQPPQVQPSFPPQGIPPPSRLPPASSHQQQVRFLSGSPPASSASSSSSSSALPGGSRSVHSPAGGIGGNSGKPSEE